MSRDMTKPTKWLCAQRRLRSAWSSAQSDRVFAVRMKKPWVLSYPLSTQRRLWSDWVDAQADLSLRRAHTHFVGFVMSRLIYSFLSNHYAQIVTGVSNLNPRCQPVIRNIMWCPCISDTIYKNWQLHFFFKLNYWSDCNTFMSALKFHQFRIEASNYSLLRAVAEIRTWGVGGEGI